MDIGITKVNQKIEDNINFKQKTYQVELKNGSAINGSNTELVSTIRFPITDYNTYSIEMSNIFTDTGYYTFGYGAYEFATGSNKNVVPSDYNTYLWSSPYSDKDSPLSSIDIPYTDGNLKYLSITIQYNDFTESSTDTAVRIPKRITDYEAANITATITETRKITLNTVKDVTINSIDSIKNCYFCAYQKQGLIVNSHNGIIYVKINTPRGFYYTADLKPKIIVSDAVTDTFEIAHGDYLVYDVNGTFRITNSIKTIQPSEFILVYNSKGMAIGPLATYCKYDTDPTSIITDFDIGFYQNTDPIITYDETKVTYTIVIPVTEVRMQYKDEITKTAKITIPFTNAGRQTFEIPHNHCLVADIINKTFSVVTHNSYVIANSENYKVLLTNSKGELIGPWARYWLKQSIDQNSSAITALQNTIDSISVPNYYVSHINTKVNEINQLLMNAGRNSDAFIFITDIHSKNNRKYSPRLIKYILKYTGINKVIMGGDYINRETTYQEALKLINEIVHEYQFNNCIVLPIVGNHEFNNPAALQESEYVNNQLDCQDLYYALLKRNENIINYDNDYLAFYYDNTDQKIRYVFGSVLFSSSKSSDSISWAFDKIYELEDGWSVIFAIHSLISYNFQTQEIVLENRIATFFDSLKNKTSCTVFNKSYDFTNKNIDAIACFGGHYHYDFIYQWPNATLSGIATTCDAMQEAADSDLVRTVGTITEQAFDVVVINRTTRKVNLVRVGAGSNREVSY